MPTNYPAGLQPSEYAEYDAYLASQGGGVTNPPPVAPPATQPVWDPTTGWASINGTRLTEAQRRDPRLYGTAGNLRVDMGGGDAHTEAYQKWADEMLQKNPSYWDVGYQEDESGARYRTISLKPEVQARLGNRIQIPQLGMGGYAETKGPNNAPTWDDEFGFVGDPSNFSDPDMGPAMLRPRNLAMLTAAIISGGILGPEMLAGTGLEAGSGALATGAVPTIADAGLLSAAGIAPEAGALAVAPALAGGGAGGIAGTGLTLGQIGTGIRTAGSALGLGRALGIGGNSSSGGSSFLNTLAQGIGGYNNAQQDKGTLNDFKQAIKDMIIQGDPYAPKRAEAIRRLGELEANPGSVTANPLFKSMSDKSQEDLSRIYASRGMNVSGNEMGGLQENFLANMNKFYGEEWNRIAKEAGVFVDPSTMASAGIRAAGDVAKGEGNSNAANNALIQRLLGGGSGGGSDDGIWSILGKLFSDDNSWDWPDGWSSDENFLDGVS